MSSLLPSSQNIATSTYLHPSLPNRRNIFDNDELDNLSVPASNIYIDHRETMLGPSNASTKAAILSALATFDSDSDERDDTYDADDVGGTVDASMPSLNNDHLEVDRREEIPFREWETAPSLFQGNAATRRGKAGVTLRHETGTTDEAVEGWALELSRDGRKVRRLDDAGLVAAGTQRLLPSTSWRAEVMVDDNDVNEGSPPPRQSGDGRRVGSRMEMGRRGGSDGAVPSEKSTQATRQKKEIRKGSIANHNRRNQRSKKMTKANLPG